MEKIGYDTRFDLVKWNERMIEKIDNGAGNISYVITKSTCPVGILTSRPDIKAVFNIIIPNDVEINGEWFPYEITYKGRNFTLDDGGEISTSIEENENEKSVVNFLKRICDVVYGTIQEIERR